MKILNKTKYVPLLIIGYALVYAGNIMVKSILGFIHGKVSLIVMVLGILVFLVGIGSLYVSFLLINLINLGHKREKESLKERLPP